MNRVWKPVRTSARDASAFLESAERLPCEGELFLRVGLTFPSANGEKFTLVHLPALRETEDIVVWRNRSVKKPKLQ